MQILPQRYYKNLKKKIFINNNDEKMLCKRLLDQMTKDDDKLQTKNPVTAHQMPAPDALRYYSSFAN